MTHIVWYLPRRPQGQYGQAKTPSVQIRHQPGRFCDHDVKPDRSPVSCTWLPRGWQDDRTCDELSTSYHVGLSLRILITEVKIKD